MIFDNLIVHMLLPDWPELDNTSRRRAAADTAASVRKAMARAPFHVRAGVSVLSLVLGGMLRLRLMGTGRTAGRAATGGQMLEAMQLRPGPLGSVIRLYRSATLLAYFEHPEVATQLLHQARPRS